MDGDGSRNNGASQAALKLELTAAMERFINGFGLFFEGYNIPRIGGQIMGLLLVAAQPLSAEDMAALLKVSRASISTNIRLLLSSGIAERVHVSGDRRDFYQLPSAGMEVLLKTERDGTVTMRKLAEQGLEAIGPDYPARAHMEEFSELMRFVERTFATIIDEWRKYKAERNSSQGIGANAASPSVKE